MSANKSFVSFSAREQALSSDINRVGKLAARELQDQSMWAGAGGNQGELATIFDAGQAPLAGLLRCGGVAGAEGTFSVTVEAGEGFLPGTSADADLSAYDVVRWATQVVAWPSGCNPDATNPKICLIVATPANVGADPASRNILTDPVNRRMSPQIVNKTSNPFATLSVVEGTAGAAPAIPAVPSGKLPLWAVYVPAAVTESADFAFVRMTHRRVEFPTSSQHGVLQGCVPRWALTNEATSNIPALSDADVHRVVIDGELISLSGMVVTAEPAFTYVPGTAGTSDEPYYLYLVGGRHARQVNYISGVNASPLRLVESTVPPNVWGMPQSDLVLYVTGSTPKEACVFIGVGYIVAGGTNRKGCLIDGDWVYAMTRGSSACPGGPCFNEPDVDPAGASYSMNVSLTTNPNLATMVDFGVDVTLGEEGTISLYSRSDLGSIDYGRSAAHAAAVKYATANDYWVAHATGKGPIPTGGEYRIDYPTYGSGNIVKINFAARGYNMGVPRISR